MQCPNITTRQNQIILGTILGGSSLAKTQKGKNYYLMMRDKNVDWIRRKAGDLLSLATKSKKIIARDGTNRWNSKCHPRFKDLAALFYKNKKRHLNSNALDQLMDIGLAVWYLDSGTIEKNKILLNTNIWGLNGTKKIIKYFEIIDYETKIINIRKSIRVEFSESSTTGFLKLISPCISEFNIQWNK